MAVKFAYVSGGNSDYRFALYASHLTVDGGWVVQYPDYAVPENVSLYLKNSVFVNVRRLAGTYGNFDVETEADWVDISHNGFYNSPQFGTEQFVSPVYPFQTVGGGAHYLVDAAGFRNVGTTNINPALLAELRNKTTYPPVVLSNITISGATTWPVQAQRDTDIPDLGYHYDPLDYLVCNVVLSGNSALTLEEGVALACFGRVGLTTFDAGKLISRGSPTRWNKLCFYQAVQEQPVRLNNTVSSSMWLMEWYGYSPPAVIQARFTDFIGMAMPSVLLSGLSQQVELRDCRIGPGTFNVDSPTTRIAFTNNLLERVNMYVGTFDWVCPIYFYNNLVRHSSVYFDNGYAAPVARWIHDNLFDTSTIGGAYTNFPTFRHSHNAYYMTTRLAGSLGGDKILTAVDYQPGPLGDYYYPSTGGNLSQLIGAGSGTAAAAGLYHYTVKPNNLKEGEDNNPPGTVDIGYHYVACNAQGQPIDTDGDGIPDYLEDRNGNGIVDSGETPWDPLPTVTITSPISGEVFIVSDSTNIMIFAAASDNGSVTNVEFYSGNSLLGVDPVPPYMVIWSNVPPGTYALSARATDNLGQRATSGVVNIRVLARPTVSITTPTNNEAFVGRTNLTISATAGDKDGNVVAVRFYAGRFLLGTDTSSPYSVVWSNVMAGTYFLTAVAVDDSGLSATSPVVKITVASHLLPVADAYVRDGSWAGSNFGASVVLETCSTNRSGNRRVAYLKFDVGDFTDISTAQLRVFGRLSATGSVGLTVYSVT
ncbi:MAG: Ig-like domain-containing protein, partial [Verrucomicrobiae bacterium]|nr:Ig-like domain-containing protein [Verrucomicrobiae bacterium]